MRPIKAPVEIGHEIIDVITAGMYSNPLMILREYVQNSVDAIDQAVHQGKMGRDEGLIDIHIDGETRSITVEDNGIGIPNAQAEQTLCALGCSEKDSKKNRGFRGIGRLGGVGYCDLVQFQTRSRASEKVSIIEWDAKKLRMLMQSGKISARKAIRDAVKAGYRRATKDEPGHFFRVRINGTQRFHRDDLMNLGAIISYLGQVAPVPFDRQRFSFADEIEDNLQDVDGFESYNIRVNGQKVYRPYADAFEVTASRIDEINGIEFFDIASRNGKPMGQGWYANTGYLASLPPRVSMRGIRVRQGNLEIGDEYFLADSFAERRFATWHIGEIHLGYSLTANARRDGFEHTPEYETFLEQVRVLGTHLSHLCRNSSKNRCRSAAADESLAQLEAIAKSKLFIDNQHLGNTKEKASRLLAGLSKDAENGMLSTRALKRLSAARDAIHRLDRDAIFLADALDGRKLRYVSKRDLVEAVAKSAVESMNGEPITDDWLQEVFGTYLL